MAIDGDLQQVHLRPEALVLLKGASELGEISEFGSAVKRDTREFP